MHLPIYQYVVNRDTDEDMKINSICMNTNNSANGGFGGGGTENARLANPAPSKIQGWKTRDRKTRHQLAGVENEGINCMDSQWDNSCNLLK